MFSECGSTCQYLPAALVVNCREASESDQKKRMPAKCRHPVSYRCGAGYLIAVPLVAARPGNPANTTAAGDVSASSKSALFSFVPKKRTPVVLGDVGAASASYPCSAVVIAVTHVVTPVCCV